MPSQYDPALTLAVAIVSYRDKDNLAACLDSVIKTAGVPSIKIIVFDNNSKDGTVEMVRSTFPQVTLIESPANVGLTKGLNACIRSARADYILALDSDTIVTNGAIASLTAFMQAHPDMGAVGGRLYYLNGTLQETARTFPTISNAIFGRHTFLGRLFPNHPSRIRYLMAKFQNSEEWFEADYVSAACLLTTKAAWQAIGGFDENFFVYWCDADFCFRIRRAGYKIACVPGARVFHCEQFHPGRKKSHRMIVDFHRGAYRFYTKSYFAWRSHPMRLIAWLGLTARMRWLLMLNACKSGHSLRAEQNSVNVT